MVFPQFVALTNSVPILREALDIYIYIYIYIYVNLVQLVKCGKQLKAELHLPWKPFQVSTCVSTK
jgi:hypothetical protein